MTADGNVVSPCACVKAMREQPEGTISFRWRPPDGVLEDEPARLEAEDGGCELTIERPQSRHFRVSVRGPEGEREATADVERTAREYVIAIRWTPDDLRLLVAPVAG